MVTKVKDQGQPEFVTKTGHPQSALTGEFVTVNMHHRTDPACTGTSRRSRSESRSVIQLEQGIRVRFFADVHRGADASTSSVTC